MTTDDAPNVHTTDRCPQCGAVWAYEIDGKRFTRLIGIVDPAKDRVVAWRCPGCGEEWIERRDKLRTREDR